MAESAGSWTKKEREGRVSGGGDQGFKCTRQSRRCGRICSVLESFRIHVNGGLGARMESGEEEEGKKEDNAGTHDFDRTVEMSCISAARSKSNGD